MRGIDESPLGFEKRLEEALSNRESNEKEYCGELEGLSGYLQRMFHLRGEDNLWRRVIPNSCKSLSKLT